MPKKRLGTKRQYKNTNKCFELNLDGIDTTKPNYNHEEIKNNFGKWFVTLNSEDFLSSHLPSKALKIEN
jgi:hypothetical protein